jgi:LacI family transcriptional regulator
VKKKVSLKDVASHLGVSTALVSYVLNGKEKEARVSAQMADKIRKAVVQLKYQPNLIAKSLKSGKTNTIGLIVADISNPFFSNIARIIEDEAKKEGYVVIFGSSDESDTKQEDLINVFLNRQVDAFILSPAAGTESQIRLLKKRGIPVVLIDRYFAGVDADSVHINNFQAAHKAVQHLIENGRKRIGMVSYKTPMAHMQDRVDGYLEAMKENRIKVKKEWRIEASYSDIQTDINAGLDKLLDTMELDAILFASNSLAVAGLKRILEYHVHVPDQLAIISFDETDIFDFFYSPVTYISQSVGEIGKDAVLLASERIRQHRKKSIRKIVDSKLVIRESCGSKLTPLTIDY